MWDVLTVFLIPFGGGIPAGVVLAGQKGLDWPVTAFLYFVSDVVLAFVFEAVILLILRGKMGEAFRKTTKMMTERFGAAPGPFALVMISFGIDPMTGRTAALMMGHGFVTGWLIAIAGDMIYFAILMVSTLCLNNILGNGTWTVIIVMIAMFGIPYLIRKIRAKGRRTSHSPLPPNNPGDANPKSKSGLSV
jgi:hypothetical protein